METDVNSADTEDAILARTSAEFLLCFAQFNTDCDSVNKSKANNEALLHTQETRPWKHSAVHRQWRRALKQLSKLAAHTKAGAQGKARVIRCCFEHGLAFDEDVAALINSLIFDLDRGLHDNSDCTCQLLPAGSSANSRAN